MTTSGVDTEDPDVIARFRSVAVREGAVSRVTMVRNVFAALGATRPVSVHPLLAVLRELDVRRHVAVGLGIGGALAVAMYAYRVMELGGPAADVAGSPALFLLLAFVLGISTAALVTVVLTLRVAVVRARE